MNFKITNVVIWFSPRRPLRLSSCRCTFFRGCRQCKSGASCQWQSYQSAANNTPINSVSPSLWRNSPKHTGRPPCHPVWQHRHTNICAFTQPSFLQRRGVPSFVRPFWMIDARAAGHYHYRGELVAAIFAGVLLLFRAFIELVAAFVWAVGMARASGGGEQADWRERCPQYSQ